MMTHVEFLGVLEATRCQLESEALVTVFPTSSGFEERVREVLSDQLMAIKADEKVDFGSHAQAFPDICLGSYGIEVKFTEKDTWRGIANSISQGMKDDDVQFLYVLWGKMGGDPEVAYGLYEEVAFHVRTSHVPRFEIDMETSDSWFSRFELTYSQFSDLNMEQKMDLVRRYTRQRMRGGSNTFYWFIESQSVDNITETSIKFFDDLDINKQRELIAEELLLFPLILHPENTVFEFDTRVLYFLNRHRLLYPQRRCLYHSKEFTFDSESEIRNLITDLDTQVNLVINQIDINVIRQYWDWGDSDSENIKIAWLNKMNKILEEYFKK